MNSQLLHMDRRRLACCTTKGNEMSTAIKTRLRHGRMWNKRNRTFGRYQALRFSSVVVHCFPGQVVCGNKWVRFDA